MLSRGAPEGPAPLVARRRPSLLIASLALHLLHAADVITLVVCAGVLTLLIVERERFRAQTERGDRRRRLRDPRRGWGDRHAGRLPRRRGGRPRAPSPPSSVARRAPGLGRASGRRGLGRLPAHHRSLRLHQPPGRGPQPDCGGALPVDPAGRRPAPVVGARRDGPACRRDPGPRHRAAARHRHARLLRAARTRSNGSSIATPWSPTPFSAASVSCPPIPSGRSPSEPTSGTRSVAMSTGTGGAWASWVRAKSGCRRTRPRECASSTSGTRQWWTPGNSRSRAGK